MNVLDKTFRLEALVLKFNAFSELKYFLCVVLLFRNISNMFLNIYETDIYIIL